jgi:hypothetical protein
MVSDDETLYRNVSGDPAKGHFSRDADNRFVVSQSAFHDPEFKPSVDRAHLRENDPTRTRRAAGDGVCKLVALHVRGINPQQVADLDQKGNVIQTRNVDVIPDAVPAGNPRGLPENPAHALVITTPQIAKKVAAWGKVRTALAWIATQAGWAIEPGA